MKLGRFWLRPDGIAHRFVNFWIGGTLGLAIGAIIAIGMNEIYPLF